VDFDGKVQEDEMGKLSLYLPKRYAFLDLRAGSEQGLLRLRIVPMRARLKQERRFVDYTDRKPTVRTFFGRQKEPELNEFLGVQHCAHHGRVRDTRDRQDHSPGQVTSRTSGEQRHVTGTGVHEWVNLKILLPRSRSSSQLGKKGLER
jgi:hypothetical protein